MPEINADVHVVNSSHRSHTQSIEEMYTYDAHITTPYQIPCICDSDEKVPVLCTEDSRSDAKHVYNFPFYM